MATMQKPTPRVEAVISEAMKKHPGESPKALATYFEAVHQELAPLARDLERENEVLRTGDTCARHCEGTAYRIEARKQKHRADVLAATIRELRDVVTHDAETKADFIERVRGILAADPDARVTPNA